ncbi:MAG TPA: hypothetical protein VNX68_09010, partial [Nitrosopumilaceae archaeon]|nr:hypothetical protein [Nitrosopumilaceae archaeon]
CSFQIKTTSGQFGTFGVFPNNNNSPKLTLGFNCDQNFQNSNGKLYIQLMDNNFLALSGATALPTNFNDGNPHIIVITAYPPNNLITISVDGNSYAITYNSQQAPQVFSNFEGNFLLGARSFNGSSQIFFPCSISTFQIGTSSTNSYGFYSMNEGSGITINDSSTNANNGTLIGNPLPSWGPGFNLNLPLTTGRKIVSRNLVSSSRNLIRSSRPLTPSRNFRVNPLGINPSVLHASIDSLTQQLELMVTAGIRYIRYEMVCADQNPSQGVFEFTTNNYDEKVALILSYGFKIIALLDQYNMPSWMNTGGQFYPPTAANYQAWCQAVASHYVGQIDLFEMGNEPNIQFYWNPYPNYAAYVAFLQAGYAGIKTGNPNAKVVCGGAASIPVGSASEGIEMVTWLDGILAAGALGYYDYLCVHPYAGGGLDGVFSDTLAL